MTAGWRRPSLLPLGLVAVAAIIILVRHHSHPRRRRIGRSDWPKCFGTWTFAVSEEEQLQWWEDNPDATEDTRGAGYTYTTLEIFSEWVHRLLVGLVAVPISINALWMHRLRDTYGARVRNTAALAGVLLVAQAGVGALTVMYDNRDWTVALHLCMATIWTSTLLHQYIAMRKVEGVSWGMFSTSATFLARHRARTRCLRSIGVGAACAWCMGVFNRARCSVQPSLFHRVSRRLACLQGATAAER